MGVKADDGVLGMVHVNEATSCDAILVNIEPRVLRSKTLGEFRETSTKVL